MSARSQRGIHDTATTKRFRSPRITVKNRVVKPQITYDYDAAVSQPDIPNLLNNKKIGRSTMVSGLPLKKRALKNRLKGRIMSSKNFQKRSQEYKTKSLVQKNKKTRSLDSENANPTRKTIISSSFFKKEDHITEKGNIDNNDIVYNEDLTNLRKNLIVDGKNISSKDTTKEAIGNDDNQITEAKVKDKRSDDYESVSMRSPVQVKHSKIPRAKITTFPAHTFDEFHPTKLKTKESPQLKCLMASDATNNAEVTDKEEKRRSCYKEPNSCKQDIVRFEAQDDTRIVWNKEETSTLEADEEAEDHGLTTADESPAIISSIGDPRILRILRNMKPNCPCKSCAEHDPISSNRQEEDSDLKSSSPEENKKRKWSLKHRKHVYTSSEDVGALTDCNSEHGKKERKDQHKTKSTLTQRVKTNSIVNASPKISNRRQSNFSFFNALFDIIFWPYLFLKANRGTKMKRKEKQF